MEYETVLKFWFEELTQAQWWKKDQVVDQTIKERFLPIHAKAIAGKLLEWRKDAKGRLAEIIIIDQFSRNIFRDTPQAFAYDPIALTLAQEAIHLGTHQKLTPVQKSFLYLPFMHSESKKMHEIAVKLFSETGLEGNLNFELKHKTIIDRYGRYPHRNKILERESTPEELEFLQQKNSSF